MKPKGIFRFFFQVRYAILKISLLISVMDFLFISLFLAASYCSLNAEEYSLFLYSSTEAYVGGGVSLLFYCNKFNIMNTLLKNNTDLIFYLKDHEHIPESQWLRKFSHVVRF